MSYHSGTFTRTFTTRTEFQLTQLLSLPEKNLTQLKTSISEN